jgi:hypothetical protein
MAYGTDPDQSHCGSTNIGGGVDVGTRALTGVYPGAPGDYGLALFPDPREDSIWVLIVLTDGAANASYNSNGSPNCPDYTWAYTYTGAPCRDLDVSNTLGVGRHASGTSDYDADDQARDMFDIADGDNISIYTIGLGNLVLSLNGSNGPPGETLLKYPETQLGNGKYFFAPTSADLIPAFQAIANLITSRINQ